MRTFHSDNNAGLCPEALQALREANDGSYQPGYGDDAMTAEAVVAFQKIFGNDTSVWFVATGTAANTLAIASLTQPWQRILCHAHSHLNADESTAPERITQCRVSAIHTDNSKLTVADIEKHGGNARGDVHVPQPGVLTISNPTEFGTVYTVEELHNICDAAHSCGYRVHVDGARFANAVASLNCDPCELANNAGVDALSYGGTKNGLAFGEAVIFFKQDNEQVFQRAINTFEFLRKGTGHLLSKHRFVSAPFTATLKDKIWLKHAHHANQMASALSASLVECGCDIRFPTESNGVFVSLPEKLDKGLKQCGHQYYHFGESEWNLARLMCSYSTTQEDLDRFISDVRDLI